MATLITRPDAPGTAYTNAGATTGTATPAYPTVAAGDLLVLVLYQRGACTWGSSGTITGWTRYQFLSGATYGALSIYTRRATGSESGNLSVAWSGSSGTTQSVVCQMVAFRNVAGTTDTDGFDLAAAPTMEQDAAGVTRTNAGCSTVNPNAAVIYVTGNLDGTAASNYSGWTGATLTWDEAIDVGTTSGSDASIGLAWAIKPTTGATGAISTTGTANADLAGTSIVFSLKSSPLVTAELGPETVTAAEASEALVRSTALLEEDVTATFPDADTSVDQPASGTVWNNDFQEDVAASVSDPDTRLKYGVLGTESVTSQDTATGALRLTSLLGPESAAAADTSDAGFTINDSFVEEVTLRSVGIDVVGGRQGTAFGEPATLITVRVTDGISEWYEQNYYSTADTNEESEAEVIEAGTGTTWNNDFQEDVAAQDSSNVAQSIPTDHSENATLADAVISTRGGSEVTQETASASDSFADPKQTSVSLLTESATSADSGDSTKSSPTGDVREGDFWENLQPTVEINATGGRQGAYVGEPSTNITVTVGDGDGWTTTVVNYSTASTTEESEAEVVSYTGTVFNNDFDEDVSTSVALATAVAFKSSAVAEAAEAVDALRAETKIPTSATEAATATAALLAGAKIPSSIPDSAAAADSYDSKEANKESVTETASATEALVAYLKLPVSISEAVAAADAYADKEQNKDSVTETVSAAEVLTAGTKVPTDLTESVTAADASTATVKAPATQTDAASSSETLAAVYKTTSAVTEVVTSSGTESGAIRIPFTGSEAVGADDSLVSEKLAGARTFDEPITEAVTAAEALNYQLRLGALLTDSCSSADSLIVDTSVTQSLSESAAATDAYVAKEANEATVAEVVASAESAVCGLKLGTSLANSGSATDSANAVLKLSLGIAEASGAADSYDGEEQNPVTVFEGVSATDSAIGVPLIGAVFAESVAALESFATAVSAKSIVEESTSITDSANGQSGPAGSVTEPVVPTVDIDTTGRWNHSQSEPATADETLRPGLRIGTTQSESASSADALNSNSSEAASISEAVSITEVPSASSQFGHSLTDAAIATDSLALSVLLGTAQVESALSTDAFNTAAKSGRDFQESAAADAAYEGKSGPVGTIVETVTATDTFSTKGVWSQYLSEAAPASDSFIATVKSVGILVETSTVADFLAPVVLSESVYQSEAAAVESASSAAKALQTYTDPVSANVAATVTHVIPCVQAEYVSADEHIELRLGGLFATVEESAAATDLLAQQSVCASSLAEVSSPTETIDTTAAQGSSQAETVNSSVQDIGLKPSDAKTDQIVETVATSVELSVRGGKQNVGISEPSVTFVIRGVDGSSGTVADGYETGTYSTALTTDVSEGGVRSTASAAESSSAEYAVDATHSASLAIAEPASASSALAVAQLHTASITETVSSTEAIEDRTNPEAEQDESVAATESQAAIVRQAVGLTESAVSTSSLSTIGALVQYLNEAASLTEEATSSPVQGAVSSESVTASESTKTAQLGGSDFSESVSASFTNEGQTGPAGTVTEPVQATDVFGTSVQTLTTLVETASASTTEIGLSVISAVASEAAQGSAALSSVVAGSSTIAESAAPTAQTDGATGPTGSLLESVAAIESFGVAAALRADISEQVAAQDAGSLTSPISGTAVEDAVASDSIAVKARYGVSSLESAVPTEDFETRIGDPGRAITEAGAPWYSVRVGTALPGAVSESSVRTLTLSVRSVEATAADGAALSSASTRSFEAPSVFTVEAASVASRAPQSATLAEGAAASDAFGISWKIGASQVETAPAYVDEEGDKGPCGTVTEQVRASDSSQAGVSSRSVATEQASAEFVVTRWPNIPKDLEESASSTEALSRALVGVATASETVAADSSLAAKVRAASALLDSASLIDSALAGARYSEQISESAVAEEALSTSGGAINISFGEPALVLHVRATDGSDPGAESALSLSTAQTSDSYESLPADQLRIAESTTLADAYEDSAQADSQAAEAVAAQELAETSVASPSDLTTFVEPIATSDTLAVRGGRQGISIAEDVVASDVSDSLPTDGRSEVISVASSAELAGGVTLPVDLSEDAACVDAIAGTTALGVAQDETVDASALTDSIQVFSEQFVESAASTDMSAGDTETVPTGALVESVASDVTFDSKVAATYRDIAETVSAQEVFRTSIPSSSGQTETLAASDSVSAGTPNHSTQAEAVSAADAVACTLRSSLSVAEAATATETATYLRNVGARYEDAVSSLETFRTAARLDRISSESASATESLAGKWRPSTTLVEAASSTDSLIATVIGAATTAESASSIATLGFSENHHVSVIETVAASDSSACRNVSPATLSEEVASGTSFESRVSGLDVALLESVSSVDQLAAELPGTGVIAEAVTSDTAFDVAVISAVPIEEQALATDEVNAGFVQGAEQTETAAPTHTESIAGMINRDISEGGMYPWCCIC